LVVEFLWEGVELVVIPLCCELWFVVFDVLVCLYCLVCVGVLGVWVVVPFEVALFVCFVCLWSVVGEWFEVDYGCVGLFSCVVFCWSLVRSVLSSFLYSSISSSMICCFCCFCFQGSLGSWFKRYFCCLGRVSSSACMNVSIGSSSDRFVAFLICWSIWVLIGYFVLMWWIMVVLFCVFLL